MRIAEVAARTGVPASTLRYYEDLGLLKPARGANGYRLFDAEELERVRFIAAARRLGLPLEGIATLLTTWETQPCARVGAELRPMVADEIDRLDDTILESGVRRDALAAFVTRLDGLVERTDRCGADCAELAVPSPASTPVACSLGDGMAHRLTEWQQALAGASIRRTPCGLLADLPTASLGRVTALAAAEQECCPFLDFTIALHGPRFTLTITAPEDAAVLLDALVSEIETHSAR